MAKKLKKFDLNVNQKSAQFIRQLNEIIVQVNKANNIKLSVKGAKVSTLDGQNGHTFNVSGLASLAVLASTAAPLTVNTAKVIETAAYADPENFTLSGGRAYFTLRAVGTAETVWSSVVTYTLNSLVNYPTADDSQYKSIKDSPDNLDKNPVTETDYWTKQEEIKIEHALGADGKDIRLFVPWPEVGAIVPIITLTVDESPRTYLWGFLTYGGTDSEASIRWNEDEMRAMATYK